MIKLYFFKRHNSAIFKLSWRQKKIEGEGCWILFLKKYDFRTYLWHFLIILKFSDHRWRFSRVQLFWIRILPIHIFKYLNYSFKSLLRTCHYLFWKLIKVDYDNLYLQFYWLLSNRLLMWYFVRYFKSFNSYLLS